MRRSKILMATTALPTALLGKTPESMPRVVLRGELRIGAAVVWLNGRDIAQVSGWELKAA